MHETFFTVLAIVAIVIGLYFVSNPCSSNRKNLPFPPGPKPLPIVGNIYDVPSHASWKTFKDWGAKYGDIIYFHTFGRPVIVLNSAEVAHELLNKRSAIYSYRPQFAMVNEVIGWKFSLTSMDYGEKSKRQRRYMQSYFQKNRLSAGYGMQLKEAYTLLNDLIRDPDEWKKHLQRMAVSVSMMVAYGHQVKTLDDPFIGLAEKGVATIAAGGVVGVHIVDLIPWLRYIPDWLPGGSLKRVPPGTRENLQNFLHIPFNQVKKQMAEGTAVPCYVTSLLEETRGEDEEGVLGTAALIYSGGFDTTMSTLETAFSMLVVNPIIQARAQAEMDLVVGKDRFPVFADRDQMPYMRCIISEAIRWGVAHRLSEDDYFNGYYLPANSTVIANQWAMLHDSRVYPEPERFDPDRFLDGEGRTPQQDPRDIAFGFGRRICPGKDTAENLVWSTITSIFYAFKVAPARDANGDQVPVDLEYIERTVRHLKPFKCTFTPRRANTVSLIRELVDMEL
ncbi:cytochrome P450 [Phlebopus sp. FC_14]|nr:cytochrome P450 [Phlebopus sp. FC_14]